MDDTAATPAGGLLIGYARVSTKHQDPATQVAQLQAAGCTRIFVDAGVSGRTMDRREFGQCLEFARSGDTITVCRLDRLGRTVSGLLDLAADLQRRGVNLRSLTEGFDPNTATGRAMFGMFAVLAEMQRQLTVESINEGLATARAAGRVGGRPRSLTDEQVAHARQMLASGSTAAGVARTLGISRATLYRALGRP
jgi:DNA invertase Pin-like site-specific DNA recombinase